MKKILFQGDSITDALRRREEINQEHYKGCGYPTLISARLGYECPGEYHCINRGVAGDRSVHMLERIYEDFLALKPDVISILIGVNDVWNNLGHEEFAPHLYETCFSFLISQIKKDLSDCQLMILEPFVLCGSATENNWKDFSETVPKIARIAKEIAFEADAIFIPLQEKFDELAIKTKAELWLYDGVHPTSAGHELIAREWLNYFKKFE